MHAAFRRLGAATAGLVLVTAVAPAAFAAAPANDLSSGAIAMTDGYTATLDTTEATTDAQDTQANVNCGAPATDASVWYTLAGDGKNYGVDVSASNYSAGVIVATGTPGSLTIEACGPGGAGFAAASGTTYWILVFDDQLDGAGVGGSLSISLSSFADPTVSFTVDPTGTVDKAGNATITGTATCTEASGLGIDLTLAQKVGRGAVTGFGFSDASGVCDGTAHPWSVVVAPDYGKFAGGKTATVTLTFACTAVNCAIADGTAVVQLKGTRK